MARRSRRERPDRPLAVRILLAPFFLVGRIVTGLVHLVGSLIMGIGRFLTSPFRRR